MSDTQHSLTNRCRAWVRAFKLRVIRAERAFVAPYISDLIPVFTLLVVLIHIFTSPRAVALTKFGIGEVFTVILISAIALKPVRDSAIPWAIMSGFMLYRYVFNGLNHWVINHYYLYTYWVTAIALSLTFRRSTLSESLRVNSRWIIGLCFAFATMWKIIPQEFYSGTFFHFMLLTNIQYFLGVSHFVGGLSTEVMQANHEAIEVIKHLTSGDRSVILFEVPRIAPMAKFLAIWTIFVEGMIGVLFLSPTRSIFYKLRHIPLITFIVTTYPIASVVGFAMLLATMAIANCRRSESVPRLIYTLAFLVVPIFQIQWAQYFLAVMNRLGLGA